MKNSLLRTSVLTVSLLALTAAAGFAAGRGMAPTKMTERSFPMHTAETAPESSRATLAAISGKMGFVPNMLATMAESPAALNGYVSLSGALSSSTLTPIEQNVAQIAASVVNQCSYCVPAHATIGLGKMGMTKDQIDAIELDKPLADAKLEAVRVFARAMVDSRGQVSDKQLESFLSAGFTRANALDIVAIAAQKTLSNYTNAVAHIPTDEQFAAQAWSPGKKSDAGMSR